jgi:DNA-nicking Smr family endonuclease
MTDRRAPGRDAAKPARPREGGRAATAEERQLWERAMAAAKPLPDSGPRPGETPAEPAEAMEAPPRTPRAPQAPPRRAPEAAEFDPDLGAADRVAAPAQSLSGLDKRNAQRLRRGQLAIEAELDLHRHTVAEAHRALTGFIADAQDGGKRCVLVITGKGEGGDARYRPWNETPSGVLRRELPRWLSEPESRARVVAWHPARPQHGGAGALYVLLRRRRD